VEPRQEHVSKASKQPWIGLGGGTQYWHIPCAEFKDAKVAARRTIPLHIPPPQHLLIISTSHKKIGCLGGGPTVIDSTMQLFEETIPKRKRRGEMFLPYTP
jgi:hypothetical protein